MKEGWTYKTLGDITTSMADGPFGSNLKKEHYTDKPEVRIIQLSNIGEDGWREENTKYTTFEHLKSIQRSEVQPGDIVIAKMMPAGRAILCPSHEAKFVLSSDAVRATLIQGVNRRFVLYSINSPYFRKQVYENVSGSGRVRTSLTKLKACRLLIPGIAEQERIVERLDAAFAQIDELKSNAERQLAEARALFQSALTQAMQPKPGWQEKTLGEIATDMYRGSGIRRDQITKEGIPCVRYGEIYTTYNISFEDCVSHTLESSIASPKYFEHGDLLFAITGESVEDIGKTIAYMGNEKCLLGGDIICMKHNQNPKFLSYALSTTDAIKQKGFGKTKLKVVHTNAPSLKAIRIPLPPLSEQQSIVEQLDSISTNISLLEEINQKIKPDCDAMKQALLRQIFE